MQKTAKSSKAIRANKRKGKLRAKSGSAAPKGRAKEVMDRQSDRLPGQTRCEGMRIEREIQNGSFGRRTIHQGQQHCRANRPDTNLQPA